MKKILTLTTVTILTFGFIGQAADDADNRFKVYVGVDCDDENIKSAVESYIKRELRALRDVDIVRKSDDADYFLRTVTIEDKLNSGRKLGYSIAYCYYKRIDRPPLDQLDHVSGPGTLILKLYLRDVENADAVFHPMLGMVTGSIDTLKALCERIVVDFDTGLLEPSRGTYKRKLQKWIREQRRHQPPLDDLDLLD